MYPELISSSGITAQVVHDDGGEVTPEMIELAKRAVACKGWRWMPGMRYRLHPTHPWFRYDGDDCCDDDGNPITQAPPNLQSRDVIPDLTDPATLGCLLALVREAWGMPTGITVSYSSDDGQWGVSWSGATHGGWCGRGKTEAEALVAALEGK